VIVTFALALALLAPKAASALSVKTAAARTRRRAPGLLIIDSLIIITSLLLLRRDTARRLERRSVRMSM